MKIDYAAPLFALFCLGLLAGVAAGAFTRLGMPLVLAAFMEEALKAALLYAGLRYFEARRLDGIQSAASGLALGVGFGAVELASYFIAFYYHDLSLLFTRLPPLLMHAFTGALFGYAIHLSKKNKNKLWLVAGFALALGIHLAFNYLAFNHIA